MKKKIKNEVFSKHYSGDDANVKFSDLPKNGIQDDDIIDIRRCEGFMSENESYDAYTELVVIRYVEETDAQYEKRITREARDKEELKKRRYESYLRLKSEFEPQQK
jgi:hypothetical protein